MKNKTRVSFAAGLIIAVLAGAFSYLLLTDPVKSMLNKYLPEYTVTLYVLEEINENATPNREVWIEEIVWNGISDIGQVFNSAVASDGFEYRKAEDYQYNNDVIVCTGGAGSFLKFVWPAGETFSMKFWKQHLSGMVHISVARNNQTLDEYVIDLYANQPDQFINYRLLASEQSRPEYFSLVYGLVLVAGAILFFIIGLMLFAQIRGRIKMSCMDTGQMLAVSVCILIAVTICSCFVPGIMKVAEFIEERSLHGKTSTICKAAAKLLIFFGIDAQANGSSLIILGCCAFINGLLFVLLRSCTKKRSGDRRLIIFGEKAKENKLLDGADIIKCVGALFVMMIHTYFEIGYYEISPHEKGMASMTLVYVILLTCVPIFITMTGYLMRNKTVSMSHYKTWFKYYIPYVLIMLISQIYGYFLFGGFTGSSLLSVFSIAGNGYMSMFFGVFMLIPFLNILWEKLTFHQRVGMILGLLYISFVPSISGELLTRYWIVLAPLSYYYTGMLFRSYRIVIDKRVCLGGILLVAMAETIYVLNFSGELIDKGFFWEAFNNYENTYYILPTYILTFLIVALVENVSLPRRAVWTRKLIRCISVHSLESYLISTLIVQGMIWRQINSRFIYSFPSIVLWCPLILVIELAITLFLGVIIKRMSAYIYKELFDH